MQSDAGFRMVQLASGSWSIRSLNHRETFHPVIGPEAEADALYVRQLQLVERLRRHVGPFVIWDVGLGAAANPITVLRAVREIPAEFQILSFDQTLEPLQFALKHTDQLPYLKGYESFASELVHRQVTTISTENLKVNWRVQVGDFPALLTQDLAESWPKPHAILFDAYSPARNPEMWTQPLFERIFQLLDPPCVLPTYSRSTMLRVSLLLAGFFVGAGHATGEKEETTMAANQLHLIEEPLDQLWLKRARHSTSAEPLWNPIYRQAPLSAETLAKLERHPQFQ